MDAPSIPRRPLLSIIHRAARFLLRRAVFLTAVAAVWLTPPRAEGQTGETFLTGLKFNALTYHSGVLFWKNGDHSFNDSIIQRVPAGGSAIHTYFQAPATHNILAVRAFTVDAARRVYWVTADGRISTLPANAVPGTTPTFLASLETPFPPFVSIAVSRDYVYWAETVGELREAGAIFRAPINGGSRSLVTRLDSAAGGGATYLHAVTLPTRTDPTEVVYYRNQRLMKLSRAGGQVSIWFSSEIVPLVDGVAAINGRLYFAESSASVGAFAIKSLAMDNTTALTFHANVNQAGLFPSVKHIAADSQAIYWQEVRGNGGPIMRHWRFTSQNPEAITATMPPLLEDVALASDGRHLYWGTPGTIKRLPVNAAATTWNLRVVSTEIVQAVSKPGIDVPLVANKPAWVRVFGQIQATNSGQTQVATTASLHGSVNGLLLPGSPLFPEMGEGISYTRAPDRRRQNEGWWFRIPKNWMTGTPTFTANINADSSLIETTKADNRMTLNVLPRQQKGITLYAYPLRTNHGTIGDYNTRYQRVINLAEALLPTPDFDVTFPGGPTMEEWEGLSFGPYELTKKIDELSVADDESPSIFIKLGIRRALLAIPAELFNDRSIHHGAFFPTFWNRAFNGTALYHGKLLLCDMELGGEGVNRPRSGVTLAHELAHNFDRKHVNCPTADGVYPEDPDPNYPHPPCFIDNAAGPDSFLGFDGITRTLISPLEVGDLMSYASTRWTSDYTWRAMFNKLSPSSSPAPLESPIAPSSLAAAGPSASPTGNKLLIAGAVSADGTALLEPGVRLPDAAAQTNAAELLAEGTDKSAYQLRVLSADGVVLATVPVSVYAVSEGRVLPLFSVIDEDDAAVSVQLVKTAQPATPLTALSGGGGAPAVSITAPTAGQVAGATLAVRWNATDPDGHALRHTVRYSHDGGTSWRVLSEDLRTGALDVPMAGLPGGPPNNALIEVLASDGLRTGVARSALFTVPLRAPTAHIFMETGTGHHCSGTAPLYRAGETVILHGRGSDPEDGPLDDAALSWTVTGPRTGTGTEFLPGALPPGSYNAHLSAADSSSLSGGDTHAFTVAPKMIADAPTEPVLDGVTDDAVYTLDPRPIYVRKSGEGTRDVYVVRLARNGTFLFAAVSGVAVDPTTRQFVSISVDADNSGSSTPQTGDRRFIAYADGELTSEQGNGSVFVRDPVPAFSARISSAAEIWHAEFQIPLSFLGDWNGQIIGLNVAVNDLHWFAGTPASATAPEQWADVQMASDTELDLDADGDTLADTWETTHLGGTQTNGSGDLDGDGQSDASEYHAGTNPASPSSRFAVGSANWTPAGIELRWPSVIGHCYDVEASSDLTDFATVGLEIAGTGADLVFTLPHDPAIAGQQLFVRLKARKIPTP